MARPLQRGGWWTAQCRIHVAPWLSGRRCERFLFAVRRCIQFRGWRPTGLCSWSPPHHVNTTGYPGRIMSRNWIWTLHHGVSRRPGMFWCYIRGDIMFDGQRWHLSLIPCESRPTTNDKYFSKLLAFASVRFDLVVFSLCPLLSLPSPLSPGVWWTPRMSSATSSQSRCPRRCGTGWPPPSPARWAWCCGATKRSLASAASSTPFRLASLLRGKHLCVCVWCTRTQAQLPTVSDFNEFIWIVAFISPHLKLLIYHQPTQTRVARGDLKPLYQHL